MWYSKSTTNLMASIDVSLKCEKKYTTFYKSDFIPSAEKKFSFIFAMFTLTVSALVKDNPFIAEIR